MQTRKKGLYAAVILFCCISALFGKGRVDTDLSKAYFELAQGYAEIKKYDKAIEYYQKSADDPVYTNAAEYELARMYALKGEWKTAIKLLELHYKKAQENTVIRNAFAYALAAGGETERACALYKKVYESDQENPETVFNYIRILIVVKNYDEAQKILDAAKITFVENAEKKNSR